MTWGPGVPQPPPSRPRRSTRSAHPPARAGSTACGAPPVDASLTAAASRHNRVTTSTLGVLLALVVLSPRRSALCPTRRAHGSLPLQARGTTVVDGKTVPVMQGSTNGLGLGVTPIGPTWDPAQYLLGADNQGRDVAARLLYGGRNRFSSASPPPCCAACSAGPSASSRASSGGLSTPCSLDCSTSCGPSRCICFAICLSVVLLTGGPRRGTVHAQCG